MTEQERIEKAEDFDSAIEEGEEIQAVGLALAPTSPLDMPVELFKESLDRRKANRDAMMTWIRESLVEGTDFGRIHFVSKNKCPLGAECKNPKHFAKPSLFKPGSEKILGMLGVTVNWPTLAQYEQMALDGKPIKDIILRCQSISASGEIVAEGMGARSVAQDSGDLNKALKMAKKSGMIDMTLTLGGLSEIFTQDIEDMVKATPAPAESMENLPEVPEGTDTKAPKPETTGKTDLEKQQQLYGHICEICGIDIKTELTADGRARLSAELVSLTEFESEGEKIEGEKSLRNLKGKRLNVAIGKAKAKLGHLSAREELLSLIESPDFPKGYYDGMKKIAEDKRIGEVRLLEDVKVAKGLIADKERDKQGQQTL